MRRNSELFRHRQHYRSKTTGGIGGSALISPELKDGLKQGMRSLLEKAGLAQLSSTIPPAHNKKTLHLIMKPDALAEIEEEEAREGKSKSSKSAIWNSKRPSSGGRATLGNSSTENPGVRRGSADDAFSDPMRIYPAGQYESSRSSLDSKRPTYLSENYYSGGTHRRVRSISFSNDRNNTMDIREWIRLHSTTAFRRHRGNNQEFGWTKLTSGRNNRPTKTPLLESGIIQNEMTGIQYEASFYATDDDFLMKSSVRAFFKENALDSNDAVLFTIPSSSRDSSITLEGTDPHPTLQDFVFSIQEDSNSRRQRGLKWLLLIYIIWCFIIVRFAGN